MASVLSKGRSGESERRGIGERNLRAAWAVGAGCEGGETALRGTPAEGRGRGGHRRQYIWMKGAPGGARGKEE